MSLAGAERFVVVSDNHGDHAHKPSVGAFADFLTWWKPTIRVHAGDCFDFRFLRRAASDEEKREPVQDDIDAGNLFLRTLKPTVFLRGNHDERLWDAAKCDDGPLSNYASGIIEDLDIPKGCKVYPYNKRHGVHRLGDLAVLHGYNAGVHAVRNATLVYGSLLMGHIHSVDMASVAGEPKRIGRAIGCLCELDMNYNRAHLQTLRQGHGWAYGLVLKSGKTIVWQAEEIDGLWLLPSEVRQCKPGQPG